MRFLAVFLLIGALLGAGCGSPETAPAAAPATAHARGPIEYRPGGPIDSVPGLVLIPDGFPRGGVPPQEAFEQRGDGVWVLGQGTVERILRDDTKRPRHQRFIVRANAGPTLLFAHNIDLAPRVPLKKGDVIGFRGEYVWNDQGGVVHWTHRDRRDRKAGGWIVWKGQNFR
jgi:hypothetical protein